MRISIAESLNIKNIFVKLLALFIAFSAAFTFAQTAKKRNAQAAADNAELIYEAETLLAERGYWILKIDKQRDASTYHAIAAFQKVEGRKRTGVLTAGELEAIRAAGRPAPRFTGEAHVEIDLTRQVLFLVDASGAVTRILPVSSGSDQKYFSEKKWQIAHTPRGNFKVTRQIFGVRKAPLGSLYYPNYFTGGVAIHGSQSVPFFPASHGCVRIPNFAAKEFQTLVQIGTPVFVYD